MYKRTRTPFSFCSHPQTWWGVQSTALPAGWVHDHESTKPTHPRCLMDPRSFLKVKAGPSPALRFPWTHEPRLGAHSNVLSLPKRKRPGMNPEASEGVGAPEMAAPACGLEENRSLCQLMSSRPAALTHFNNILRLILTRSVGSWQKFPFLLIYLINLYFAEGKGKLTLRTI